MHTVKWRLVNQSRLASDIIDFVERGIVSHIEFISPDGALAIGARIDGGVLARPISYCKPQLDLRFSAEVTDEQYNLFNTFINNQIGKPYDIIDIGAIGINRRKDWRDQSCWICSELWAAALLEGGIIGDVDTYTNHALNLITPQGCLLISAAMFKFEGAIKQ